MSTWHLPSHLGAEARVYPLKPRHVRQSLYVTGWHYFLTNAEGAWGQDVGLSARYQGFYINLILIQLCSKHYCIIQY